MRRTFLIVIISTFLLGLFSQIRPGYIPWERNRPLTWDDYKAFPKDDDAYSAATTPGYHIKWTPKGDSVFILVLAFMDQTKSWVKNNDRTDRLLKHEQLHFDIYELHARKLWKSASIQKFTRKNLDTLMDLLSSENDKLVDQYQEKYDKETLHGANKTEQLKWQKEITEELKALEGYSYAGEIKLLLQK